MNTKDNPYGVAPNTTETQQVTYAPTKNNTFAITSLILGILSIFLSLLTAIPGVITGHMALSKIKKGPTEYEGKGMAIAGLVLNYFFLILGLLIIASLIFMTLKVPGFSEAISEGFNEGIQQGKQY